MASSYFVTFGNNRLTFPGATGSVAWEDESPVAPTVPGIVIPFAGMVSPEGYLLCDGSEVSRSTYALLYAVIGDTYGAGDGSTTFNLPDLRGRVVIGVAGTHALGSTGGSETVTLTEDQLPAHSHVVPQHGHENNIAAKTPALSHSITQPMYKYNRPNSAGIAGGSSKQTVRTTSTQTATRGTNVSVTAHASEACTVAGSVTACQAFNSGPYGGGGDHNNMQPYTVVNYLISTGE
jgi:microcystin-dependent protein